MSQKIFKSIFAAALIAAILALAATSVIFYRSYTDEMTDALGKSAVGIAEGAEFCGYDYLDKISGHIIRINLISPDGSVLFDNKADAASLENHLSREEIKCALEFGSGYAIRRSKTLSEKTAYYAVRLSDGNILRISENVRSYLGFSVSAIGPFALILILIPVFALLAASRVSKSIVKQIVDLDLENPEKNKVYKEMKPVIKKISEQNRLISAKLEELGLKQSEFSAITDNMSEGMLVINSKAEILSHNTSALRQLGITEPIPKSLLSVELPDGLKNKVAGALSGISGRSTLRKNGAVYSVLISPVVQDGVTEGAVIVILDETEKEQREELRREFTSNVSHELKTPLTSISGFAELIMNGIADGDDAKKFAANIYNEAGRLINLVGDIIRLSRLDGGEIPFDAEETDLFELSEAVGERLLPIAEKCGVSLGITGDKAYVRGNRTILEEMLYNLCDNAIKYNIPGGSVFLETKNTADGVLFTCRDTGIGIPEESIGRVFERFYRVDKSHSKKIGGTGLGLSIVKHGAQYHGAEIKINSEKGKGTEISLLFPKK